MFSEHEMRKETNVRQYERRAVDIDVELRIGAESADQVAFVSMTGIRGRMKNISGGGAYIVVPSFLPRECEIDVDLPAGHGIPDGRVAARVVKISMIDREPTYGLGLVFEEEENPRLAEIRAHLSAKGEM